MNKNRTPFIYFKIVFPGRWLSSIRDVVWWNISTILHRERAHTICIKRGDGQIVAVKPPANGTCTKSIKLIFKKHAHFLSFFPAISTVYIYSISLSKHQQQYSKQTNKNLYMKLLGHRRSASHSTTPKSPPQQQYIYKYNKRTKNTKYFFNNTLTTPKPTSNNNNNKTTQTPTR